MWALMDIHIQQGEDCLRLLNFLAGVQRHDHSSRVRQSDKRGGGENVQVSEFMFDRASHNHPVSLDHAPHHADIQLV